MGTRDSPKKRIFESSKIQHWGVWCATRSTRRNSHGQSGDREKTKAETGST